MNVDKRTNATMCIQILCTSQLRLTKCYNCLNGFLKLLSSLTEHLTRSMFSEYQNKFLMQISINFFLTLKNSQKFKLDHFVLFSIHFSLFSLTLNNSVHGLQQFYFTVCTDFRNVLYDGSCSAVLYIVIYY